MTPQQLSSALQGAIGLSPVDAHQRVKEAISDFLLDNGHQAASIKFIEAMAFAEPPEDAPTFMEF